MGIGSRRGKDRTGSLPDGGPARSPDPSAEINIGVARRDVDQIELVMFRPDYPRPNCNWHAGVN